MKCDKTNRIPMKVDVIAYTFYNTTYIQLREIIGETQAGNPKVIGKNKWFEHGAFAIQGEFVIVPGVDPNTI